MNNTPEWDPSWLKFSSSDVNLWTEEDYEKQAKLGTYFVEAGWKASAQSDSQPRDEIPLKHPIR